MKLMVYSHDAFGLGNIRRMLEICQYLLKAIPNLSILLVSGSPMLQGFRLPPGLDYIKLPCLNRGESGDLSAKYLRLDVETTVKLRADLILTTALSYKPDLVLVDKKPYGLKGELQETLSYLKTDLPETKLVLLLRDILDQPETTCAEWQQQGYYDAVRQFFHQVLAVGMPDVFNLVREYDFPRAVAHKVRYCGYIRKEPGRKSRHRIRRELGLEPGEDLVLVTPGGGEDGFKLVETYLQAVPQFQDRPLRSLIFCGPEMPAQQQQHLHQMAAQLPQVMLQEFTDDAMSYISAADLVVCMSGYNTITEVLSQGKQAIAVPRVKPSHEQLIRTERMAKLDLLHMIHPDDLTPETLRQRVLEVLSQPHRPLMASRLDLQGLPRIADSISRLLFNPVGSSTTPLCFPQGISKKNYLEKVAS